jgi:hypothetical protein
MVMEAERALSAVNAVTERTDALIDRISFPPATVSARDDLLGCGAP